MKTSPIIYAALTFALLSPSAFAAESQKQPAPSAGADNTYAGMMPHMAEMEKRMARMREMMDQCAKGEKHCQKDQMMGAMKDMQSRMGDMMKYMNSMPDAGGAAAKPPASDDHSDHNHDKK